MEEKWEVFKGAVERLDEDRTSFGYSSRSSCGAQVVDTPAQVAETPLKVAQAPAIVDQSPVVQTVEGPAATNPAVESAEV